MTTPTPNLKPAFDQFAELTADRLLVIAQKLEAIEQPELAAEVTKLMGKCLDFKEEIHALSEAKVKIEVEPKK